jgi:hypothetical protein
MWENGGGGVGGDCLSAIYMDIDHTPFYRAPLCFKQTISPLITQICTPCIQKRIKQDLIGILQNEIHE